MNNNELLKLAKNYLGVTFDDEDTDKKLLGIVGRSRAYIDRVVGKSLQYGVNNICTGLLLENVRFTWINRLEDFEKAFLHELIGLQIEVAGGDPDG